MAESVQPVLSIAQRDGEWCIRFNDRADPMCEIPADYDASLEGQFGPLCRLPGELRLFVDLSGVPAISSRQLGILIAVQRILRPRIERLPIRNAGPSVQRLLDVTRTDRFFEVQA